MNRTMPKKTTPATAIQLAAALAALGAYDGENRAAEHGVERAVVSSAAT